MSEKIWKIIENSFNAYHGIETYNKTNFLCISTNYVLRIYLESYCKYRHSTHFVSPDICRSVQCECTWFCQLHSQLLPKNYLNDLIDFLCIVLTVTVWKKSRVGKVWGTTFPASVKPLAPWSKTMQQPHSYFWPSVHRYHQLLLTRFHFGKPIDWSVPFPHLPLLLKKYWSFALST